MMGPPDRDDLRAALKPYHTQDITRAVTDELVKRTQQFATGIRRYRTGCPDVLRPAITPRPQLFRSGNMRLLDGGNGTPDALPILIIPSHVNRYYILDLYPENSLIERLCARGFRPLIIDWGTPDAQERHFTLDDYMANRLLPCVQWIVQTLRQPQFAVMGYCMGGLFALALAGLHQEVVKTLTLLATPWNFAAEESAECTEKVATQASPPNQALQNHQRRIALLRAMLPLLKTAIAMERTLSVDVIQSLFMILDPWNGIEKYQRLAHMPAQSPQYRLFIALEDWLNDGVPLAGPLAMECLDGWYGQNTPARGLWRVMGKTIDPAAITRPAAVCIAQKDYIVLPEMSLPLAEVLPDSTLIRMDCGHIGMICGAHSEAMLVDPLAAWLRRVDAS